MSETTDILVTGTGAFAARILFDLAATADAPTQIAVAGRNAPRLAWLATAARARAHMFGRPVTITSHAIDLAIPDHVSRLLVKLRPAVILQAASLQPGSVIAGRRNAWVDLVAMGGLSASAVFQAVLSARVAHCCMAAVPGTRLVNACFPDVANSVIAALGLPITCGIGNIQILAHAFGGELGPSDGGQLRLLAHYQNLGAWRRPAAERQGSNARVWIDGQVVADLFARFAQIQLTPEPVIDISGAAAAPLLLALAHRRDWRGHVPGPEGLPGGYPVHIAQGNLSLDLPAGISRDEAVAWNLAHEQQSGLVVDALGHARYTGRLHEALAAVSPDLAGGFHVRDLETVFVAMQELRGSLVGQEH